MKYRPWALDHIPVGLLFLAAGWEGKSSSIESPGHSLLIHCLLRVPLASLNLCRNTDHGNDDPGGPGKPLVNSNRDLCFCLVFGSFLRSMRSGDGGVSS